MDIASSLDISCTFAQWPAARRKKKQLKTFTTKSRSVWVVSQPYPNICIQRLGSHGCVDIHHGRGVGQNALLVLGEAGFCKVHQHCRIHLAENHKSTQNTAPGGFEGAWM